MRKMLTIAAVALMAACSSPADSPNGAVLWWDGADLIDFFERVEAIGPENVRIEYRFDTQLLYIVDRRADVRLMTGDSITDPGYNYSHRCPPDCP